MGSDSIFIEKSVPMDIMFLLGAKSGEDGEQNFKYQREMVLGMLSNYAISDDLTRVGIILYGKRASVQTRLAADNDEKLLKVLVSALMHVKPEQDLSSALKLAKLRLFSDTKRRNVPKQIVLFVTSKSDEDPVPTASQLLSDGVDITVIAVGSNANMKEVSDIVGGRKDKIFNVNSDKDKDVIVSPKPGKHISFYAISKIFLCWLESKIIFHFIPFIYPKGP